MAAHEFIIADWDVIATYITPTYFNLEDTLGLEFGFGFDFNFRFGYGYGFGALSLELNYKICHRLWIRNHKRFNQNIFNVLNIKTRFFVWFKQFQWEWNKQGCFGCWYEKMINMLFNELYINANNTTVWNMENRKKQHQSADVTDIPIYGMA